MGAIQSTENADKIVQILPARALTIALSDDNKYWSWKTVTVSGYVVEEAHLNVASYVDIVGKKNASSLKPNVLYKATFVVKLKANASGWNAPVKLEIVLPNGSKQESQEILQDKPKGEWLRILAGNFILNTPGLRGEIQFKIYQHGEHLKTGLIVTGLVIEEA